MLSKKIIFKIFILIIFLAAGRVRAIAQEQFGLRLDNFAGVSGLPLNPSAATTYPLAFDINILGGGFFGSTNVGHVQKASVLGVLRNSDRIAISPNLGFETTIANPKYYLDFRQSSIRKYGLGLGRIDLPSFLVNFYGGHSFGMVNSFRTYLGSSDLPKASNYYLIKNTPRGMPINIEPFRFALTAWTEIGLNYGYRSELDNGDDFGFGITLKYLLPVQAIFFENRMNTKITEVAPDVWVADSLNLEVAFTKDAQNNLFSNKGSGFGADLGISYVSQPDQNGRPAFRLGFSLLDLGRMTFSNNSELHRLAKKPLTSFSDTTFGTISPDVDFVTESMRIVTERVLGSGKNSKIAEGFDMTLPTALNFQADLHLEDFLDDNFFVGGALIQRIGSNNRGAVRPNQFVVAPRWETRWLGASLPVSLLEWQQVRVGFSARLAFLTLGTADLTSFIYQNKLRSSDFYIALKFNPFSDGKIGEYGGNSGGRSKSNSEKCYKF